MIYFLIYITTGFIWGIPRLKESFKRYRGYVKDESLTMLEEFRNYFVIFTIVSLQNMLFFPYYIYQTLRQRGKKS